MANIKSSLTYSRTVWGRNSHFHQKHDFLPHITELLLSKRPISDSVKV